VESTLELVAGDVLFECAGGLVAVRDFRSPSDGGDTSPKSMDSGVPFLEISYIQNNRA